MKQISSGMQCGRIWPNIGSCDPSLSKREYLEAKNGPSDAFDRFVRRIIRFFDHAKQYIFRKKDNNHHSYFTRRKSILIERLASWRDTYRLLNKHVISGTCWQLFIHQGDTAPRIGLELQHDDMSPKQSERLNMQAYMMRQIFERMLSLLSEEIDCIEGYLQRNQYPSERDHQFKIEDVISAVVEHVSCQLDDVLGDLSNRNIEKLEGNWLKQFDSATL